MMKKGQGSYKRNNSFITIMILLLLCFFFSSNAESQHALTQQPKMKGHPKIGSSLYQLFEEHVSGGLAAAQASAKTARIEMDQEGKVVIFLLPEVGKTKDSIDIETLKALGCNIIKAGDYIIKARIPIHLLKYIADNVKGISFIKVPDKPHADGESEGVSLTGAYNYYYSNYYGQNIKVAIIDTDFGNLSNAVAHGVLPNSVVKIDCTGTNCIPTDFPSETDNHGTAVAEVVSDMAPSAQLYLIKFYDTLDLKQAKNYCIANGIKIINHSLTWFGTNFYDGSCYNDNPVCTANDAYNNGILWVNSAGNFATQHYEAIFSDPDGNGSHNVAANDECINIFANFGDMIQLALTWDAWPVTDQDYDLYLLFRGTPVASSAGFQTGIQPPIEMIDYSVPASGTYCVSISNYHTTSNHRLVLFSLNHDLSPYVSSGSVTSPADATGVMAVGAIDRANWTTGPQEGFSSQGPTTDGRIKPDVSGPDGVSSYIFGSFWGTSASAPHVAGAAALILSATPSLSVSNLWDALIASAIDMGVEGPDNIFGYGRLNLPSQVFVDVPFEDWAFHYINAIYNAKFTTGCSQIPLSYCPGNSVNREQMAAFVIRAVEGEPPLDYCASGTPFSDVTSDMWSCRYIKRLKERNITAGYSNGMYEPYNQATREEMAALLIRAVEGEPPLNYCDSGSLFPDVAPNMWSCKYIKKLKELGITTGYKDGTYGPYDLVTRDQMAAFLSRAFLGME